MKKVPLSEVKDDLSRYLREAEEKAVIITRHGKPEAVVLGFADWERLSRVPSFGRLLMSAPIAPGDLPRRNRTPMRRVKL